MTAFILFALATAEVQGFAFTLGIGTLLSLFTAVLATQAALGSMGRSRLVGHPAMLGAARRRARAALRLHGRLEVVLLAVGHDPLDRGAGDRWQRVNFGIDFNSGTRIQTGFTQPVSQEQIRTVLRADKLRQRPDPEAHRRQERRRQRLPDLAQAAQADSGGCRSRNRSTSLQPAARTNSDTSIGPTFGQSVANAAVIAIIASLIVISVYIALRFEWKYAVPVLIALMHDLLITAGVYALTGREVTTATVAALLTILGYSLYDTIIVFDRVRENVPRMPRAAFSQIVNRSMSEVLTRSLATSFCTLLPVLALLLFGGETLKNFAFALMVGIASGAYSSIFIASPVLTHWKEREGSYRNRRARLVRDLGAVPPYADRARRHADRRGAAPSSASAGAAPGRRSAWCPPRRSRASRSPRRSSSKMVRDLDIERDGEQALTGPAGGPRRRRRGAGATAGAAGRAGVGCVRRRHRRAQAPAPAPPARASAPEGRRPPRRPRSRSPRRCRRTPAADLTPEDLVLKEQPKRPKRPRNRRHGRAR